MDPATDLLADDATDLDWSRPHPITIVVEIGRAIRSVVVALVVVRGGLFDNSSVIELFLVAAPLVGGLARWYTTRYALDAESVHHHHGLIWRKKQVLPRSNVQNVSTKAGILARTASVVELQISDASATGDIAIRYVTQAEADRLTTLLRSSSSAATSTVDDDDQSTPQPSGEAVAREPLVAPSLPDLARAEATTVSSAAVLVLAALVATVGPLLLWLDLLPFPDGIGRFRWLIVPGAAATMVVIVLSGIAGHVLAVGGFRLFAEPDRLRIQVGLVTEARVTARRERIQQLRVLRELTHRRVGIERIGFETADLEAQGTAGTAYLSPVSPAGTWRRLAAEVFGPIQLDESDLRPVSPLTVRRIRIRFGLLCLPLLALGLVNPLLPVLPIAAVFGFGWWYGHRRYRVLGWAISADQYLVRRGVIYGRLTLVRLDKIQSLRLDSSIFQRRLDLATLKIATAGKGFGGLVLLPDLPRDRGEQLLTELATRAAATPHAETL